MGSSTLITPRDQLAPAGERVSLEVEVERRFWTFFDPPRAGVEVEVEGAGKAVTDASGEAAVDLGPRPAGLHRLTVRAAGGTAEARVAVAAKDAPIFITDIDHTIADVSPAGFIFKPLDAVRPVEGAVDALWRIASRMQIVYLTARDHIFARKTRSWLELHRFPDAPVYLRRRTRFWSVGAAAHKMGRLGELRSRFSNILWGVGDMPGDVRAYAHHGIRPILLGPRALPDLPAGTLQVTGWAEIADMIK